MKTKVVKIPFNLEIPDEWNLVSNRELFEEYNVRGIEGLDLLSVSQSKGVIPQTEIVEKKDTSNEDKSNYKQVKSDQIVYNKMRMWQGAVGVSKYEGIVSPAYVVLKKRNEQLLPEYFHYQFRTSFYIKQSGIFSYGLCDDMNSLRYEDFKNMKSILPPKDIQQSIVHSIKHVNNLIDDFINRKQRAINLLREYKQSKINELITKGLNPNVKMKDSGIDWLGMIPEHWERFKLKHIGTAQIGITYSPNDLVDQNEGILVLRSSNIQNGKLSLEDNIYVRNTFKIDEKQIVREGDILICSRNGSAELIGKNIIISKDIAGNTFGAFMTIFRSKYNNYLKYFFNSDFFKSQMGLFSTTTINQLTNSILNNLVIIMPRDMNEIEQVIKEINAIENKFEKLVNHAEKQIELIQEYRQSLIYELVIGKRKP